MSFEYPPAQHPGEDRFDRYVAQGLLHREVELEPFDRPHRTRNGRLRRGANSLLHAEGRGMAHNRAWKLVSKASAKGGWNDTSSNGSKACCLASRTGRTTGGSRIFARVDRVRGVARLPRCDGSGAGWHRECRLSRATADYPDAEARQLVRRRFQGQGNTAPDGGCRRGRAGPVQSEDSPPSSI